MNKDYHMWDFWRDRYDYIVALEEHYTELLKSRQDLQMGIAMIRNGERIINSIMEELDTK